MKYEHGHVTSESERTCQIFAVPLADVLSFLNSIVTQNKLTANTASAVNTFLSLILIFDLLNWPRIN